MFKFVAAAALVVTTASCAPRPTSTVSLFRTGDFDTMSCLQVKAELASERINLAALKKRQADAAAGGFWALTRVSNLMGSDVSAVVGASKSKVLALEQRVARCN